MKKLFLLLAVLPLLCCNLLAQNVNDDVLLLQKSNASLKSQLKDQRTILSNQIKKTDSIMSLLQSANSEIKKNADNQNSINQSIGDLKNQTANINQGFSNVSYAFSKRKNYSIIAFIGSIFIVLIYLFYLGKKFACTDENINTMSKKVNKTIESEILSVKEIYNEQLSLSAKTFDGKMTELNETFEKKIAAIKSEFSANRQK